MAKSIGIIGASGYTGAELLRLVAAHPEFEVACVTAHSQAGNFVGTLYPHLSPEYPSLSFSTFEESGEQLSQCDAVFSALPHGEAMKILPSLETSLVIDLGSDFRLEDESDYIDWYGRPHECASELGKWTYGLSELFRAEISNAKKIANPGCYPTAVTLALAPLLKAGLVETDIVVNAVSGTSGAGRVPAPGLHFSHHYGDFRAYKVTKHQHTPEIEFALKKYSGKEVIVSFTTHLIPAVRGIHASCVATLKSGITQARVDEAFNATYEGEHFVDVVDAPPGIKDVSSSNRAAICPVVDSRCGKVVVLSVIDNLVKGASGQAIQNANIRLGLAEDSGLSVVGLYP